MSFDVYGDQEDTNTIPCYCVECSWDGTYEECDYRPNKHGEETWYCPECGSYEIEDEFARES